MFASEAESAYLTLQSKALAAQDNYTIDRVERALDEIIRNPENTKPAAHQVRSAWANAGKVLENRRKLVVPVSIDEPCLQIADVGDGYHAVEIFDWLDRSALRSPDRALLRGLAAGADAPMIAETESIPVQRIRERISRARRAGLAEYQASVVAA